MQVNKKRDSLGFSLIEVLVVITILGILASIAILSILTIIENSKRDVCNVNTLELGRMYGVHLESEGIEHSEEGFAQYFLHYDEEVCPSGGSVRFIGEKVECSLHPREVSEEEDEDSDEEEVPYL